MSQDSGTLRSKATALMERPNFVYGILAFSTIILASNHVIGRGVHETIPPIGLSFWRWMFAALVLFPFAFRDLRESRPLIRANLRLLIYVGITVVCTTSLILVALNFTTAINVSLINALQPAFTALLAHLILKDRLSVYGNAGILLGFLGVVIMVSRTDLSLLLNLQLNIGDIIALFGIVGFALYATNASRLPAELSVVTALFVMVFAGALFILPLYIVETMIYMPMPFTGQSVLVVLAMSLLISVFVMLLWNAAIKSIGANRTVIFINLIPVSTAVMAVFFLDEQLYFFHFIGAVFICSSIFLVTKK